MKNKFLIPILFLLLLLLPIVILISGFQIWNLSALMKDLKMDNTNTIEIASLEENIKTFKLIIWSSVFTLVGDLIVYISIIRKNA